MTQQVPLFLVLSWYIAWSSAAAPICFTWFIQRCTSVYCRCNQGSFVAFLSAQSILAFSSDLWHQQHIFSQFLTILCTPWRWLCGKHPVDHIVSERTRLLPGGPACLATTTLPPSKPLKSTFFSILMLGLNISRTSSPCLLTWNHWVPVTVMD